MKFSGISFGGYKSGGTKIMSPHFRLSIYKDSKTKQFVTTIKKRKLFSLFFIFLLISIPIDTFYGVLQFKTKDIVHYISDNINVTNVTADPQIFGVPFRTIETEMYLILIINLIFLYFFYFYGVRKWHGCEHKLIASAEHNDIDNAKNYSRINDRCGGCYIFSAYASLLVYWLFVFNVLHWLFPVGALTFSFLFIFLESKLFHKYNKPGIWFGRILQKYVTTSEPLDFQLELGIKGMKELVDKEKELEK